MSNELGVRIINIVLSTIILLHASCCIGCTRTYIEYIHPDQNLIGKKITFKEQMVYQVFSDKSVAKKFGFLYPEYNNNVIINNLTSAHDALDDLENSIVVQIETIKNGMTFSVVGYYWVRHDLISREFAPDYDNLILIDENYIFSSYQITAMTNFSIIN